jgi:hypothetical protein
MRPCAGGSSGLRAARRGIPWEVIKLPHQEKTTFRVNRNYPKILRNRKHRIQRRLDPERPGHVVSHEGCVPWIDRAIELVSPYAGEITLRGDTDFTLSAELDRSR